ncbi:MAG TPA: HepT-like ribonuclease domain-containing protein [Dyadobacter sp.]|nr:HepT-like ribonuclease domain-containing protein [Dyadobacter sp.]
MGYTENQSESDFESNIMPQDAVYRRLEIIGEAATKISDTFKDQHPQIEWRLMKPMRNKLTHEYFGISPTTVYATITEDIPTLLFKLKSI